MVIHKICIVSETIVQMAIDTNAMRKTYIEEWAAKAYKNDVFLLNIQESGVEDFPELEQFQSLDPEVMMSILGLNKLQCMTFAKKDIAKMEKEYQNLLPFMVIKVGTINEVSNLIDIVTFKNAALIEKCLDNVKQEVANKC